MTSLLSEEEGNVTRLKLKSQSHGTHSNSCKSLPDENRSFLDFSRENLSISTTELEQGFNKPTRLTRCRGIGINRHTLIGWIALVLALSCVGLELWKLRRVLANAEELEILKRDVETLKHRFLERDLFDELKAFEEQLYGDGPSDDEELLSNASSDYDSSYDDATDDSFASTQSSSGDYPTIVTSTPVTMSTTTTTKTTVPCTSKELEDVLAVLRRAETERGQFFERNRLLEEERAKERHRMSQQHDERSKRELQRTRIRNFSTGPKLRRKSSFAVLPGTAQANA